MSYIYHLLDMSEFKLSNMSTQKTHQKLKKRFGVEEDTRKGNY